jgi:hypothetical protein
MLLQVEHGYNESTLDSIFEDDFDYARDSSMQSCKYNHRDTSTTARDALEDLRQNHTSILNVSSDGEESDDDEEASQCSFLFEELNEPPRLDDDERDPVQGKRVISCCSSTRPHESSIKTWIDTSSNSIRNVTESIAKSLCTGVIAYETCSSLVPNISMSKERNVQRHMENEIYAVLGCPIHYEDEENEYWTSPLLCFLSSGVKPDNKLQSRVQRIHKCRKGKIASNVLRMVKSFDNSTLNETITSTEASFYTKISTWYPEDENLIGQGLEPIPTFEDLDGYDSDHNEFISIREQDENRRHNSLRHLSFDLIGLAVSSGDFITAVQDSLNRKTSLTWHPTSENFSCLGTKEKVKLDPVAVDFWFERGHLLHNGQTVLEPQFMWRKCLTATSAMILPFQMRLLNVSRFWTVDRMDRKKYPFARTSQSFIIRMISGDEFLFEAESEIERDIIMQRCKLVVARLATLAIIEDFYAMQIEFFSTDPTKMTGNW